MKILVQAIEALLEETAVVFGPIGDFLERAGVQAVGIVPDTGPDKLVYDPKHPDADTNGYVHYPNIDVVKEMVDMMAASRAYEANVTAIQESRSMGNTLLGLLTASQLLHFYYDGFIWKLRKPAVAADFAILADALAAVPLDSLGPFQAAAE